jgi:hypothetical protein
MVDLEEISLLMFYSRSCGSCGSNMESFAGWNGANYKRDSLYFFTLKLLLKSNIKHSPEIPENSYPAQPTNKVSPNRDEKKKLKKFIGLY